MKAIKRTVAALLATLMLATSTSFTLAAENYSDAEAVVVAKVNAAGIMTGTDKGFEPSKSLTRAEAAAIIVRMKGISESAVKTSAGTTLFKDVAAAHWASGYVNQASNLGIVKGVSATEFAPDREVTVAEFVTMAVRALGAGKLVDSEGVWPTNYVNFANEEGLLDDVNAIYSATATRLNAATIVVNSLTDPMWSKVGVKSNGEIEWSNKNGKTILDNVLKLTAHDEDDAEQCVSVSIKDMEFVGDHKYDVVEGVDLSNIRVGLTYDFYTNDDNEITGLWLSEDAELKTVNFTQITKVSTSKVTLMVDGNEKEYKVDDSTVYYLNEKAETLSKNKDAFGVAYLDGNKVTKIYAEQFKAFGVVDEVKTTKVVFDNDSAIKVADTYAAANSITINDDDNEYFISKDGKAISFSDLKEGDIVAYYTVNITGGKKYVAEVITDTVKGEVTSVVDSDTFKIDGVKYDVLDATNLSLKLEDEIEAVLTKSGKIVMYTLIDGADSDVAIVSYYKEYEDKYGFTNAEVRLTYMDGTKSDLLTIDALNTIEEYYGYEDAKEVAATKKYSAKDNTTAKTVVWKKTSSEEDIASLVQLGSVICYEITGDKLTICKVKDGADAEYVKVTATNDNIVVGKKSTYLTKNDNSVRYHLTDSTKVFNIKADDDYSKKVEIIDVASLDDTDLTAVYYVAGIDTESDEIDYLILAESSIKRTSEANFAFVTDKETVKVNGNKVTKITVVDMNGEDATYIYDNDEINAGFNCPEKGDLLDITLNGEYIIDGDKLPQDPDGEEDSGDEKSEDFINPVVAGKFVDDIASKRNEISLLSTGLITYSDDVLVLLLDDNKYKVADLTDIEEFEETDSSNIRVVKYFEYKEDEDEVAEAIVIVIEKIEVVDIAEAIIKAIGNTTYTFEVNGNKITATAKANGATAANLELAAGIEFVESVAGTSTSKAVLTYTIDYKTAEITLLDA